MRSSVRVCPPWAPDTGAARSSAPGDRGRGRHSNLEASRLPRPIRNCDGRDRWGESRVRTLAAGAGKRLRLPHRPDGLLLGAALASASCAPGRRRAQGGYASRCSITVGWPGARKVRTSCWTSRSATVTRCILEAAELRASHDMHTGRALPGGINGRRLETSAARHQRLAIRLQALRGALDPEHVLDRTSFVVAGPPLVTSTGQVIAGNHRSILIQEAARAAGAGRRECFEQYRAELVLSLVLARHLPNVISEALLPGGQRACKTRSRSGVDLCEVLPAQYARGRQAKNRWRAVFRRFTQEP
jgi:hypothetical protein